MIAVVAFQLAAYVRIKHALESLIQAMAIDLAPRGIRAKSLCPTFVRPLTTAPFFANPELRARMLARTPLGRLGEVEDLMGAPGIVSLCGGP
jgi:NAD(P)-dependent dehydrogenase (short-subunit alcohol dehydrogenase family)